VSLDGVGSHERFGRVFLPSVLSHAYLAWSPAELGMFAEGRVLGEEGVRIAEAVGQPGSLMVSSWGIGLLFLRQGDLPKALPELERAIGLCQNMDIPLWLPRVATALGAAYILAGRAADAVPMLMQSLERMTATEMGSNQVHCCLSLGEAHLRAGHLEEAHALAKRALELAQEHQERGHQAYALRLLGEIAARGEPPESEQSEADYQHALVMANELGMRPLAAHCHHGLGTLYRQMGRGVEACAALSTAIALYRAMDMTLWLPQAEAALAQVQAG
jgi:tetratricopeptide (TPR) repeat protein